jgi:hypothetical protein|eukprot:Stramenopile-MAST_4_protein_5173
MVDQFQTLEDALARHRDMLTTKFNRLDRYLQENPLTAASVDNYFCLSTFYQQPALNELVRSGQYSWNQIETVSNGFTGVEFRSEQIDPHHFIVRKWFRGRTTDSRGAPNLTLIAIYYIMWGEIYQAPSVWDIMMSRVLHCNELALGAFDHCLARKTFDQALGATIEDESEA